MRKKKPEYPHDKRDALEEAEKRRRQALIGIDTILHLAARSWPIQLTYQSGGNWVCHGPKDLPIRGKGTSEEEAYADFVRRLKVDANAFVESLPKVKEGIAAKRLVIREVEMQYVDLRRAASKEARREKHERRVLATNGTLVDVEVPRG